ncbi:MAG: sensor domain-containing diguanylate cyclase [Chloroflexi bacterium]|nr:sensor domain-containing diguanylate cyclase [Chloroflexota bacterium]
MKNKSGHRGFKPQENLVSILPSILAGTFVLFAMIASVLVYFPPENRLHRITIILFGVLGSVYLAFYYYLFRVSPNKQYFSWINVLISGVALGILSILIPDEIDNMLYTLIIISAMATSLISTRGPSYFLVFSATAIHFVFHLDWSIPDHQWVIHLVLTIASIMAIETIQQLKKIAREQINRLEIINELSRQIVSTLETKQVFALLNAAFQNALEADTYYIGILDGDEIRLELFYDDGEFFQDVRTQRKGTLSNWVINHQQELFLPDLRLGIELDDVEMVIVGKEKTSLSWMGVPMRGAHVDGLMAISSYRPNAFDRSDMELLSTIAQRAALALDNTYHHALVAQEARLDSHTRVYNHGYFIEKLNEQAETCQALKQPISLIMLDIDHFKQYNDSFGHLTGDEVLVSLCDIIRSHIKNTDSVGRWGGEEFAIALPNTNGQQATLVAQRIRETLGTLKLQNNSHLKIPTPTVSMGIAVFPDEIDVTSKLIDFADKRLYIAKERGRDQIEPVPAFWETAHSD